MPGLGPTGGRGGRMRAVRGRNTDCEGEGRRRLKGAEMAAAVAGSGGLHGDAEGEKRAGGRASSGTLPCRLPHAPARCRPDRGAPQAC